MKTTPDFPYSTFPVRLEYKEGKANKLCYFKDNTHLNSYLIRHKLKKKDVTIMYNDLEE